MMILIAVHVNQRKIDISAPALARMSDEGILAPSLPATNCSRGPGVWRSRRWNLAQRVSKTVKRVVTESIMSRCGIA